MRTINVEVAALSAILLHRFSEEDRAAVEARSSHATARPSPEDAAERAAYRMPMPNGQRGNLCLPAENLLASIRRAASFHKIGRRSATAAFCAGVFVSPDRLDFGTTEYEIDSRPVVIKATQGRVMRHRPKLTNWKLKFRLEYDDRLIPNAELVRSVVDDAGARVGIGDYRPERRGSFGRFMVTSWS
jgi:hypothetical protein